MSPNNSPEGYIMLPEEESGLLWQKLNSIPEWMVIILYIAIVWGVFKGFDDFYLNSFCTESAGLRDFLNGGRLTQRLDCEIVDHAKLMVNGAVGVATGFWLYGRYKNGKSTRRIKREEVARRKETSGLRKEINKTRQANAELREELDEASTALEIYARDAERTRAVIDEIVQKTGVDISSVDIPPVTEAELDQAKSIARRLSGEDNKYH